MRVQKLDTQREIIRKINRFTRKSYQLFDELFQLRPPVPKIPKGGCYAKKEKKKIEKSKVTEDKVKRVIRAFQNFNLIWDSADFEKKKDLIMDIIKEVKATSQKIEIIFNLEGGG